MKRTEQELRRIAGHINDLLPEEDDDAQRACDLALQLKRWVDRGEGEDPDATENVSVLRRK